MWKAKTLPVPAYQMSTGTVIVDSVRNIGGVALYARVSSNDQKSDLDRQLSRLTEHAISHKMVIIDAVKEIGSGINSHRKGLMRLLSNSQAQIILVEHRDRLMRFGFDYIESSLAAQGRKIIAIEAQEVTDDVVRDLHEVIVSMCARLYGKRSAKNRAKKAIDVISEAHDE